MAARPCDYGLPFGGDVAHASRTGSACHRVPHHVVGDPLPGGGSYTHFHVGLRIAQFTSPRVQGRRGNLPTLTRVVILLTASCELPGVPIRLAVFGGLLMYGLFACFAVLGLVPGGCRLKRRLSTMSLTQLSGRCRRRCGSPMPGVVRPWVASSAAHRGSIEFASAVREGALPCSIHSRYGRRMRLRRPRARRARVAFAFPAHPRAAHVHTRLLLRTSLIIAQRSAFLLCLLWPGGGRIELSGSHRRTFTQQARLLHAAPTSTSTYCLRLLAATPMHPCSPHRSSQHGRCLLERGLGHVVNAYLGGSVPNRSGHRRRRRVKPGHQ